MIGLVDYGSGNIKSVYNSLYSLGADVCIIQRPERADSITKLILPGVGAFAYAAQKLQQTGLAEFLHEQIRVQGKPMLGICVGMQILADNGEEGGGAAGLGWIHGRVLSIRTSAPGLRIPHMGWNALQVQRQHPVLNGIASNADVYFTHSYHFEVAESADLVATANYGFPLAAVIAKDNIVGTQFHPEKSQAIGLAVLENFIGW